MQLSGLGSSARHAKAAGLYATAPALGCLVLITFVTMHVFVHQRSNSFADLRTGAHDMIHPSHHGRQLRRPIGPSSSEIWAAGAAGEKNATLIRDVLSLLTAEEQSGIMALCGRCLYHTLQTCVRVHGTGESTFVATGDIDDMWLRDSSVQMAIYLPRIELHPALRRVIEGAIRLQAYYISQDPYANAFKPRWRSAREWPTKEDRKLGKIGWVAERKYEIDSGAYYLSFLWNYWCTASMMYGADRFMRQPLLFDAAVRVLETWSTELKHEDDSGYRFAELSRGGLGPPVNYTGMSWSGFRPSDNQNTYGYNVPGNMYAAASLERVLQLNAAIWRDDELEAQAAELLRSIRRGLDTYATVQGDDGLLRYAYEVDGRGGQLTGFDDANMPSLLGIPLLGYQHYNREVYANTRAFILSEKNPYFFSGGEVAGPGSPHTPKGFVWPLALMIQALTSNDPSERVKVFRWLLKMQCGDGLMHESVNANNLSQCTRPWFEWANALFVVLTETAFGMTCDDAAEAHRLEQLKEREGGMSPSSSEWPGNHAAERPEFYETLEASIKHVWLDKSSYETYAQALGVNTQLK